MSTTGSQALAAQVKPLLQTKRKPRKKKRSAAVSTLKGEKKK